VKRYSSPSNAEGEEILDFNSQNPQHKQGKKKKKFDDVNYREVLKNKRALFAFLSITLGLSLWTFIDTTLTNKL
jgi:hypothetical protein